MDLHTGSQNGAIDSMQPESPNKFLSFHSILLAEEEKNLLVVFSLV